jgi:F-box domain
MPTELLLEIFSHDLSDLSIWALRRTCRRFRYDFSFPEINLFTLFDAMTRREKLEALRMLLPVAQAPDLQVCRYCLCLHGSSSYSPSELLKPSDQRDCLESSKIWLCPHNYLALKTRREILARSKLMSLDYVDCELSPEWNLHNCQRCQPYLSSRIELQNVFPADYPWRYYYHFERSCFPDTNPVGNCAFCARYQQWPFPCPLSYRFARLRLFKRNPPKLIQHIGFRLLSTSHNCVGNPVSLKFEEAASDLSAHRAQTLLRSLDIPICAHIRLSDPEVVRCCNQKTLTAELRRHFGWRTYLGRWNDGRFLREQGTRKMPWVCKHEGCETAFWFEVRNYWKIVGGRGTLTLMICVRRGLGGLQDKQDPAWWMHVMGREDQHVIARTWDMYWRHVEAERKAWYVRRSWGGKVVGI